LVALTLVASAGAQGQQGSMEVQLTQSRDSGVSGTAVMEDVEGGTQVALDMQGLPESGVELLWTGGTTSLVMYDAAKDVLTRWRLEGQSPAKPPGGKDAGTGM